MGGHTQLQCQKLREVDKKKGGTVCPLGCRDSRNNLAEKINSCTDVIKRRPNGCKRKVLDTLPQKIRAIQIHNKYYISKTQRKNRCTASDICVEVSLLEEGGNKKKDYIKQLFKCIIISGWVTRNQRNLICSWL